MTDQYEGLDAAEERFVERLGHLMEQDGLTRISGRIFGYLLLSRGAKSLEELATALHASKGSVSQDTRLLERVGALERVTRPGDRRVYYQVGDRFNERMMDMRLEKFRRVREVLHDGLSTPSAGEPEIAARLNGVVTFFDDMIEAISSARDAWSGGRHSAAKAGEEK